MKAFPGLLSKCIAEFIGTFCLVFAGCGAVMVAERFPGSIPAHSIPVIFGLAVAAMVYSVGHISGAHFNPAVTLAFAAARHFPLKEVLFFWTAQTAGAMAAIFLLSVILPHGTAFGAALLSVSPLQGFVWEAVLSFLLMFVITAVATDTRAVGMMAGVAIGAAVAFCAWVGGPVTGAAMNPARALAPAFFEGRMEHLWIYMLAPLVGACAGALAYEAVRCREPDKSAKGCC